MKLHAPLAAVLIVGLAVTTASIAQEAPQAAAPTSEETVAAAAPEAAPAPAVEATSSIPQAVLDVVGKPENGKGLVVFFRANRFAGSAVSFKVREGEVELGKLKSGTYILAQVEPGKHTY
ncbi:MAG: hypothetical protein ACREO1_13310, partial [Arenimonas sp.]